MRLSQLATFVLYLGNHLLRCQKLSHYLQLLSFQSWYDMPCNKMGISGATVQFCKDCNLTYGLPESLLDQAHRLFHNIHISK